MSFKFSRNSSSEKREIVYSSTKRKVPKWQWYLLVVIIASPLIYLFIKLMISLFFVIAPGYVTTDKIVIRAPYDGYVTHLYTEFSEPVKDNQTLLIMDSQVLQAKIDSLKENLNNLGYMQKNRNNLAQAQLQSMEQVAEKHVQETEEYYQRFQQYYKKGLITAIDASAAADRYHTAKIELERIKEQVHENNENFSINTQQNYNQMIAQEKNELAGLVAAQQQLVIKAPQDGYVMNLLVQEKEFVTQGTPLLEIATNNHWHIRSFFKGKYIADLYPGRKVKVIFPDFKILTGYIANQPSSTAANSNSFLGESDQKLITLIFLDKPIPNKYKVNGMGVTVVLH